VKLVRMPQRGVGRGDGHAQLRSFAAEHPSPAFSAALRRLLPDPDSRTFYSDLFSLNEHKSPLRKPKNLAYKQSVMLSRY